VSAVRGLGWDSARASRPRVLAMRRCFPRPKTTAHSPRPRSGSLAPSNRRLAARPRGIRRSSVFSWSSCPARLPQANSPGQGARSRRKRGQSRVEVRILALISRINSRRSEPPIHCVSGFGRSVREDAKDRPPSSQVAPVRINAKPKQQNTLPCYEEPAIEFVDFCCFRQIKSL
jgi:hypothetical protein